jgi:hypothetical protein
MEKPTPVKMAQAINGLYPNAASDDDPCIKQTDRG